MRPTVFIFVCGIRTRPGASDNWTGRAVTWTHKKFASSAEKAEKVEYKVLALLRWFRHSMRVDKLRSTLDYYRNWRIIIAAHSNGAAVALDALRAEHWPTIDHLHLISAAARNDLAYVQPQLGDTIKRMTVWIAEKDLPLRLAGTLPGRILGYGQLGLNGIDGITDDTVLPLVSEVREPSFGHSTWFEPQHFKATMERITNI